MEKEIQIRSDEVQEILSHVPNWMIRWGITLIFVLIILVLSLSWIIKYPDVVEGQVVLTTEQPPTRLVSQTNGYIEKLIIPNDSSITKGVVIAEIRSPISKESIDDLTVILKSKNNQEIIEQLNALSDVGILQDDINTLINNLIEYQNLENNLYFKNSINNLSDQIKYSANLATITKKELGLLNVEITNAREKFEADSILYAQGVIAKHTFYSNQSAFVSKKQQYINAEKTYVQHKITSTNYTKQKIDLEKRIEDDWRQLNSTIEASKKSIESTITNWKQKFVLTAPINGKLTYLNNLSEQQYVQAQQSLFAIIPEGESIVGIVRITNQAFGKVQLNQKVRMKLNNYPYQEFGQLVGIISEISKMPSEQGYFVKVILEDGLNTTYNKEIQYKPDMTGIAEVVTEDLRLIERVFNNFRKILDK
ncbi:MAG: HlyD family efflux transporter periplasmic adaptor subunit [Flavobacteriales bacterium]|nr:HlyD family efflux transporter periplasmic adaptor subunit [Flavobacteriales bacterium]